MEAAWNSKKKKLNFLTQKPLETASICWDREPSSSLKVQAILSIESGIGYLYNKRFWNEWSRRKKAKKQK